MKRLAFWKETQRRKLILHLTPTRSGKTPPINFQSCRRQFPHYHPLSIRRDSTPPPKGSQRERSFTCAPLKATMRSPGSTRTAITSLNPSSTSCELRSVFLTHPDYRD